MDTWQVDSFELTPKDTLDKLMSLKPYKQAQDKKGHGVFFGAWFPKDAGRRVEKIREEGPYVTTSDVIRDAIYLGLQILSLRYEKDDAWQADMLLTKMANDAEWEARVYDEEESFASSLDKLCRNGDKDYAAQLLRERISLMRRSANSSRRLNILTEKVRRARLDDLLGES